MSDETVTTADQKLISELEKEIEELEMFEDMNSDAEENDFSRQCVLLKAACRRLKELTGNV